MLSKFQRKIEKGDICIELVFKCDRKDLKQIVNDLEEHQTWNWEISLCDILKEEE